MATRSDTVRPKTGKQTSYAVGRSAATGRYVLRPASKPGSISVEDARAAARTVLPDARSGSFISSTKK